MTLQKGHNSTKGNNPDLKNKGQLFSDKESIMKFQNPILNFERMQMYKFALFSISCPSLKILAVIVFKILSFYVQVCK